MIEMRYFRDHSNERPQLGPPTPYVVRVEPPVPEPPPPPAPDLDSPIEPDQELADAHAFNPDEAFLLARQAWGHEFGVSWAAYVAGLGPGHRWTLRQVRDLRFLQWRHRTRNLS